MPIDVSMYNKGPAPVNPLDTMIKVGQTAQALAPLALGSAMQQAVDPATGNVDQNRLLSSLRQSPVGAAQSVPAMMALQQLRQAGFAADQAGLETFQKRMALVSHLVSPVASMKNPTGSDVYDMAARALDPALGGDKVGLTLPVIMSAIKMFKDPQGNWLPPDQIRRKALQLQTQAASTAEILDAHSPRMQAFDQGGQIVMAPMGTKVNPAIGTVIPKQLPPTTPVATTGGTHYLGQQPPQPGGGIVTGEGEPIVKPVTPGGELPPVKPTGPAASLAPGYQEAAAGIGAQSAQSANALTQANDTSMGRVALLDNLADMIGKFTPGKGADWTLVAKNFANRNLPVPKSWQDNGGILDLKSVASQEEFNKMAVQLAQQQFASIGGTGTDAKFNSAFETSPNETLSAMGNQNIIKLLKGNELAIQAKNKAWQQWLEAGHGPQTYSQFSTQFNEHFDPRVFQFKYLSPADRQAYVDKMDPGERMQLLHNITYARKQHWISYGG